MKPSNAPKNPKPETRSDWYAKATSGHDWPSNLSQEEEEAMRSEGRWASRAARYDLPGPTRIKVSVTLAVNEPREHRLASDMPIEKPTPT